MRKRILLAAWLLCGLMLPSWGQTESKKNPKLLIDGCFFMETPSELNGAKLKMLF
jgi:cytochrome c biogenesis protein CcmG/thiol:disulfide interchange protein DsbE